MLDLLLSQMNDNSYSRQGGEGMDPGYKARPPCQGWAQGTCCEDHVLPLADLCRSEDQVQGFLN